MFISFQMNGRVKVTVIHSFLSLIERNLFISLTPRKVSELG